jgi:ribosome maturation factor RimP
MRGKVTELLQNVLDENPSLFLIDLSINEKNHIRVIIDGDEGVKLED